MGRRVGAAGVFETTTKGGKQNLSIRWETKKFYPFVSGDQTKMEPSTKQRTLLKEESSAATRASTVRAREPATSPLVRGAEHQTRRTRECAERDEQSPSSAPRVRRRVSEKNLGEKEQQSAYLHSSEMVIKLSPSPSTSSATVHKGESSAAATDPDATTASVDGDAAVQPTSADAAVIIKPPGTVAEESNDDDVNASSTQSNPGGESSPELSDEDIIRLWRERCPALQELWPADADVTTWEGLTFGEEDGAGIKRVVKIELGGRVGPGWRVIKGKLVTSVFGKLVSINAVDVPAELGGLGALEVLNLDYNDLPSVPADLGRLGALKEPRRQQLPEERAGGVWEARGAGGVESRPQHAGERACGAREARCVGEAESLT
jgi:hypothetical protein